MPVKLTFPANHNANKRNPTNYISRTFQKRECVCYIRSKQTPDRCCCGQHKNGHQPYKVLPESTVWNIAEHTKLFETDAYGTIEFMGGQHPYKAQFVRLSFDSDPANIMHLFQNVWRIKGPNLVITVHGSYDEIQLQAKLARVFQSGLMKATKTMGAWIITTGLNSAYIVRRVARALKEAGQVRSRKSIVSIGVAPWGLVKKRGSLKEKPDCIVPYFPQAMNMSGPEAALNNRHSYFLLADNGTRGRYGAEVILRKRLEEYILTHDKEKSGKTTPVVCVVFDGGCMTLRSVLDYVYQTPPIPVVVCSDSSRISNMIGSIQKLKSKNAIEQNESSTLSTILQTFNCKFDQAKIIYSELLLLCLLPKAMITCFEIGEDLQNDFDHAILTALLKCHPNHLDQLILALTWNRADIARSDIFVHGKEWTTDFLGKAMMEALKYDRVDFVRLLIENGVQMGKFLTVRKLESLYNTDKGPANTLSYIVRDVTRTGADYKYKLPHIGLVLEKLMGPTYEAQYTSFKFKARYTAQLMAMQLETNIARPLVFDSNKTAEMKYRNRDDFEYPFNELFIWAVLTKRQQMALCMWQHGEQALTKEPTLFTKDASILLMESIATDDYLDQEIFENYQKYAREFQNLSIGLLEQCYRTDRDSTLRLLTYELENWGKQTNLSLAFIAFNKEFIAHTCCQYLLSDLWLGGLRIRRYAALKIIIALVFPAFILKLNFKSREELLLQPQRADELRALDLESLHSNAAAAAAQSDLENDEDSFSAVLVAQEKAGLLKGISLTSDRSPIGSPTSSRKKESKKKEPNLISPSLLKGGSVRARQKGNSQATSVDQKIRLTYRSNYVFGQAERPLSPFRKFYEFYVAPLTSFWIWMVVEVAYIFFLCLFSLTVLTTIKKYPVGPDWSEYYMMAYVVTLACENCRRICISEGRNFHLKMTIYFAKPWNIVYTSAILLFFVAMTLRFFDEPFFTWAILCYICDSVFWYILFLDAMSVHFQIGVYVIMLRKMIVNIFQVLLILACVLISFGVVRQSIRNNPEKWSFMILRDVLYKPYFMLYGEVYADEIDPCNDRGEHCEESGYWITPIYMSIFMLISNILIVNLMIAVFNHIFTDINAKAQEVWRFYRYSVVLDFEYKPFLPPPFIILYHIYFLVKIGFKKRKHRSEEPLKLFLTAEGVEAVQDFEETCMEEYHFSKEFQKLMSIDEKIRLTSDRVEYLSMKQDDFSVRLQMMKQNTDNRLRQILDCLKKVYPTSFKCRGGGRGGAGAGRGEESE